MPSIPELQAELFETRRALATARRALRERRIAQVRAAQGRVSSDDTVRALTAVLQHSTVAALEELRAEPSRWVRDLEQARGRMRAAQNKYSSLRYAVWRIAQNALAGNDISEAAFEEIIAETVDSEDDRDYDEFRGWVE
jgi:hypothetical protein